MDTPAQDRVRELTTAFLDEYGERIVEELTEKLDQAGSPSLLSRTLFDLAASHVREPSGPRLVTAIRRALAGVPQDAQGIISGQMVLWSVLHRMLRDTEGPHRHLGIVHAVLALAGDTIDGILGSLIDVARSGGAPSSPPGWGTLVELGRTRRELQMLHQITHDLLDTRDPGRMYEILEQGILETFHIRSLMIAAVNPMEGTVEVVRAYPLSSTGDPIGWRYALSDPDILCDVARTGQTEVIDGWDPRFHERVVHPDGTAELRQRPRGFNGNDTSFFIPVRARDRVIGVVATGSTQAGKQVVLREIERMRPFLDQVGATLSTVSEIVERRRAEEALRESETRLNLALDAARIGTWDSNLITGKLIWSESLEPMFGLAPGAFPGTREAFYECLHPEDREVVRRTVDRAIQEGTALDVEYRIVWPDGAVRWMANKGQVFRDTSSRATRMLGAVVDITARRQEEETRREAERTRVLVETAGAAAHEINQPLTVIIGLAQIMLLNESLDASLRRDVETIHEAGQKIREIVLRMQDLQKYITKPYLGEARIIDFDAAAQKREP